MRMILRGGEGILSRRVIGWLRENAIGGIRAGILKSTDPARSADVDFHPGAADRHTLGFLLNPERHNGGRAAGSLAWGGLYNTFFWIDPASNRCAVLMMQFLPFCDLAAMTLLGGFEHAVYSR